MSPSRSSVVRDDRDMVARDSTNFQIRLADNHTAAAGIRGAHMARLLGHTRRLLCTRVRDRAVHATKKAVDRNEIRMSTTRVN